MMECAAMNLDVDDGPEAFKVVKPKAIKEHICGECQRIINIGETYYRESGIWEGDPATYKTCLDCISLRNTFFDGGYYYGAVEEEISNHINDLDGAVPASCFDDLTPRAKDMVFKMMDEHILEDE